ncbi:uncharacterized protein LOC135095370 isoform X1 [Scylla paramamosain]|uniref:uncharacterized protein LOC135095370 isoform X1 n=2 Tax=Scylla paramamosain TaxID=85552 RepID=UPI0030831A1D
MSISRFLTTATIPNLALHHASLPLWREAPLKFTTAATFTTVHHRHYTRYPENNNNGKRTIGDTEPKGDGFLRVLEFPKASKGSGMVSKEDPKKADDWNDILNRWYQQYQDFVGITDLKKAQDRVTELSEGLLAAQGERRQLQREIEDLQARLVQNHQHITKTEQYSQEHMRLFSQARELNDQLREVRGQFAGYEQTERDTFTQLSAAIRDCHERERMQGRAGQVLVHHRVSGVGGACLGHHIRQQLGQDTRN